MSLCLYMQYAYDGCMTIIVIESMLNWKVTPAFEYLRTLPSPHIPLDMYTIIIMILSALNSMRFRFQPFHYVYLEPGPGFSPALYVVH